MAKQPEEISQLFRDLSQAVLEGSKTPRPYTGQNSYKPQTSRFKMKIWYRDGNARVYYSFDNYTRADKESVTDEYEGLKKLIRLAHVAHKDDIKVMVIWATLADQPLTSGNNYDYEILKVSKAGEKQNKCVSFRQIGNNSILDTAKLMYQSNKKLK